jgi:hypothetical protein
MKLGMIRVDCMKKGSRAKQPILRTMVPFDMKDVLEVIRKNHPEGNIIFKDVHLSNFIPRSKE